MEYGDRHERPARCAGVPSRHTDRPGWLAGSAEDERWRLVVEFLKEYQHELAIDRWELLADEPPPTGDKHWDVLLAALAEHLAAGDGRGAPSWAERRRLRQFWFPYDTSAARVDALVHAPAAFRRRGVFIASHDLEVA
jgi:hypothetical protein